MSQAWAPAPKNLKHYPHFDAPISRRKLIELANSPGLVSRHSFFPFLQYKKSWVPFRADGMREPKERLIRYASRRDSIIFSRYRQLLSDLYEKRLRECGIDEAVIAYRKIPVSEGGSPGKCNIHFAKEAFDKIRTLSPCCAVVMDISKYFENIDHDLLKRNWCRLLNLSSLPKDHYAVFKAITHYSVVDRKKALQSLGYLGEQGQRENPKSKLPKQLCTPHEFRQKIAGDAPSFESLIEQNRNSFGIPQGAPLSDVLANIYLMDFDVKVKSWAEQQGGSYWRYSDDILVVLPGDLDDGKEAFSFVSQEIVCHGERLSIKPEKTAVVSFHSKNDELTYSVPEGVRPANGLEYLGFRFDGKRVYLRDSTVSRFYRKLTHFSRQEIISLIKRYPGKSLRFIEEKVDIGRLEHRFGRVMDFEKSHPEGWTFWTYVRRASLIFGTKGRPILEQVSSYREYFRRRVELELTRQYDRLP